MANGELAARAKFEIEKHGGIYALSKHLGVNPGVIYRVKEGGNSPTLRRIWKIPKHEPRPRLNIDCDPALIARFDRLRGERSRGDYLAKLLDLADGLGEVV